MSIDGKTECPKVVVEVRDVTTPSSTTPTANAYRHNTHTSTLSERIAVTYFEGPHDIQKHSRLPMFLRLEGGILPKMILPLSFIGSWATAMVVINKFVTDIGMHARKATSHTVLC